MGRAIASGTPYFGSPYLRGQYASEVQGDEKALCHVSDLLYHSVLGGKGYGVWEENTKSLTKTLPGTVVQTKAG
jgi:hypothetical protein